MSFTDHKITAFAHKVSDLPDEPQIPAAELKSRFDACPEELRQSLNAVCDDAARLEARVDGHDTQINQISMEKFPDDTIQEKNLHPDLASKLNGKADQTALENEADARDALDTRLTAAETALPLKCECYFGTYTGNGEESQTITLDFTPKWLLIFDVSGYGGTSYSGGLAFQNAPCQEGQLKIITLDGNKFTVYNTSYNNTWARTNYRSTFYYIAGK